jgi:septal ring factor EnvC (AmiA/AmiB activator)
LEERRHVVRLHDPRRERLVMVVAGILLLVLAVGLFELGQRVGGHSSFRVDQKRQALRAEVKRLTAEGAELRDELARVRTSLEIDREAHARLQESLTESEVRVAELNEELEFYRRIVAPQDGQAGLRVQTFEVVRGGLPDGYRLRFLLVQNPQRSGRAQGQLHVSLHGTRRGDEITLQLQELAAEPQPFEFLYFQDIEVEIILPEGFEPRSADVELRPGQGRARRFEASYPWDPRS